MFDNVFKIIIGVPSFIAGHFQPLSGSHKLWKIALKPTRPPREDTLVAGKFSCSELPDGSDVDCIACWLSKEHKTPTVAKIENLSLRNYEWLWVLVKQMWQWKSVRCKISDLEKEKIQKKKCLIPNHGTEWR